MAEAWDVATASSTWAMLRLIRDGSATTRAELAEATGLARSTVSARVAELLARRYVVEVGEAPSSGGRPAVVLAFNAAAGAVLAADLGATHSRLAVTDFAGTPLVERSVELDITTGPEVVFDWLGKRFAELLAEAGVAQRDVRGMGIGLPGPVEHATGRPVNPPLMPGWDGVRVGDRMSDRFRIPVLVDNDVNIMAVGEHWSRWRRVDDLLFVKVATGIGGGIIAGGRLHRGGQGGAGDLGHVQVPDEPEALCRCGNLGCVEAVASGSAVARQLRERGKEARTSRDVVRLVRSGDADAAQLVRQAGRVLGEVIATAVNLLDPSVVVIGGDIAAAHEFLLAGIREVVYRRSLPLATRHLEIVRSSLGDRAGITGAAAMVIEHLLDPRRMAEVA